MYYSDFSKIWTVKVLLSIKSKNNKIFIFRVKNGISMCPICQKVLYIGDLQFVSKAILRYILPIKWHNRTHIFMFCPCQVFIPQFLGSFKDINLSLIFCRGISPLSYLSPCRWEIWLKTNIFSLLYSMWGLYLLVLGCKYDENNFRVHFGILSVLICHIFCILDSLVSQKWP